MHPTTQPLVLVIATTCWAPVFFHRVKNIIHPQHQGEHSSSGVLCCCSSHSENPASKTSGQRMGLDHFREGFQLYSRLSFFLPLWLTPPHYEPYVLCGWKTELISHQDRAALVSKICSLCKISSHLCQEFCQQQRLFPKRVQHWCR